MAAYNQILSLIRLIDDESPFVRSEVIKKLSSFGPNLRKEINNSGIALTASQRDVIEAIEWDIKSARLSGAWLSWQSLRDQTSQMELALILLAEFLHKADSPIHIKSRLDQLADEYKAFSSSPHVFSLARFLFQQKRIKGNERDYYNPQNSNLQYVLARQKGIPISLTCIYILVGKRLGLKIDGCHFPGHFLARVEDEGKIRFVDCFNEGLILTEADILRIRQDDADSIKKVLYEKIDTTAIIKRTLANLIRAFSMLEDQEKSTFMIDLFKRLEESQALFQSNRPLIPQLSAPKPFFSQGQIVRHLRYGYRGIIVDVDSECKATDKWYYANQTQPDRFQAWYHVLVNDSEQISYVAQSNLQSEEGFVKIAHPLLAHFFTQSSDGKYLRNDTPWPDMNY